MRSTGVLQCFMLLCAFACDGPLFKGRRMVVVGGGNTAVTKTLYLHNMGVDVTLVHRRDKLRAQEALARELRATGRDVNLTHRDVEKV